VPDRYCIRDGYTAREIPAYYVDDPSVRQDVTWQPDVYRDAAKIARRLGARRIIDIGPGDGVKLAAFHPEFEVIGVDFGTNLNLVRQAYPFGSWREHDLDMDVPLPLGASELEGCVIVCADVIEHLRYPELLLAKLREAMTRADAVVLSTPERELTWGVEHCGPPPNECHVREWTIDELAALFQREGFEYGDLALTRSNDQANDLKTILACLFRTAAIQETVVPEQPEPVAVATESDKFYWHRYIDFYEQVFATLHRVTSILEFGVLEGDSIRWLADRFPEAKIVGCDIVPVRDAWPTSPNIEYVTIDQGSVPQLRTLFERLGRSFDLVIDDGSHEPVHQRNCLVESLPYVRPGGIYVIEDIHTSHPEHQMYRELGRNDTIGPLHLLLALEHLQARSAGMTEETATRLASHSLFTKGDVHLVHKHAKSIDLYRRTTLPHRCYQCGTADFEFGSLRCRCGVDLCANPDSMSAIVRAAA
jgi:SAM-dependent methyltransferase